MIVSRHGQSHRSPRHSKEGHEEIKNGGEKQEIPKLPHLAPRRRQPPENDEKNSGTQSAHDHEGFAASPPRSAIVGPSADHRIKQRIDKTRNRHEQSHEEGIHSEPDVQHHIAEVADGITHQRVGHPARRVTRLVAQRDTVFRKRMVMRAVLAWAGGHGRGSDRPPRRRAIAIGKVLSRQKKPPSLGCQDFPPRCRGGANRSTAIGAAFRRRHNPGLTRRGIGTGSDRAGPCHRRRRRQSDRQAARHYRPT